MSVVASYLLISARYDGMVLLNGATMDPRVFGGQDPGPHQRVGAMVGYGSYGRASRLTRTVRLDNIAAAQPVDGLPGSSSPVRVPAFARNLTVTAANPAGFDNSGESLVMSLGTALGPAVASWRQLA